MTLIGRFDCIYNFSTAVNDGIFLIVCVVLEHRWNVILTSHACWKDEQLLFCGIDVHHRGLSAVGEYKSADSQMKCSIFVYRVDSFSISEEYASNHCRNYASHRISESYAERILFFLFFFTICPIPPLSCHTGRFCIFDLCTLISIFLLLNMAF